MGKMSKAVSHLPERPQPPSLAEQDIDIESAEDSDNVFQLGAEYLADYQTGLPSNSNGDSNSNSSLSSPNASSAGCNSPGGLDQSQINDSYTHVTRLLSLYTSLKEVPSDLEDKYCRLRNASDELKESVSQLRTLSDDFGLQLSEEKSGEESTRTLSKTKTKEKSKRKK